MGGVEEVAGLVQPGAEVHEPAARGAHVLAAHVVAQQLHPPPGMGLQLPRPYVRLAPAGLPVL